MTCTGQIKFLGLLIIALLVVGAPSSAQYINYSATDPDPTLYSDIRIIGKLKDHYLIYKSNGRTGGNILVYDKEMNFIRKSPLGLAADKLLTLEFLNNDDYSSVLFQIVENGMIYCKFALLNENGEISGEIIPIDSLKLGIILGGLYSIEQSHNKKHTLLSRSLPGLKPGKIQLDHLVLDEKGNFERNDHFFVECSDDEQLSDPKIDDQGNIVFFKMKNKSMLSNLYFYKSSIANDLEIKEFELAEHSFQIPMIKIDDLNGLYHIISLYKNNKSKNTIGLLLFNMQINLSGDEKPLLFPFDRELLKEADKEAANSTAFNYYNLKDFISTTNGGFAVTAVMNKVEGGYKTRFASGSRRDDIITTYGTGNTGYYTPPEAIFRNNNLQSVQSQYTKRKRQLMIFTFDKDSHLLNYAHPNKSGSVPFAPAYTLMNLTKEVLFVYNEVDNKNRVLLNNFSLDPVGTVTLNGIFRNLDKGYSFFPESGKQVDATTMIIPCELKGKLAFAKINFPL